MSRNCNDIIGVLKGLQMIVRATSRTQEEYLRHLWSNSSIREILDKNLTLTKECKEKFQQNPKQEFENFNKNLMETFERTFSVAEGLKQFTEVSFKQQQHSVNTYDDNNNNNINNKSPNNNNIKDLANNIIDTANENVNKIFNETITTTPNTKNNKNLDVSSITLKELEDILSKKPNKFSTASTSSANSDRPIVNTAEKRSNPNEFVKDEKYIKDWMNFIATHDGVERPQQQESTVIKPDVIENIKSTESGRQTTGIPTNDPKLKNEKQITIPELSSIAKQRRVPSSRIGRLATFGGLFAGLGIGTVSDLAKGALGLGGSTNVKEAFFNPANAERIVDTLCKVRGAALKIGQILSIQDSSVVSPQLAKAFDRVRQAADYMPNWQVDKVMASELGSDWRTKFKSFDDKPFAAASIGQVHRGVMPDGTEIAIKIQYPGVAKSIESDIDNLVSMLKIYDVFPPGIFIDNVVQVAKRELVWEVDYIREAEYTDKFGKMIDKYQEYRVPKVIRDVTTKSVLTTELVAGVPLDKCFDMDLEHRQFVGSAILKLCCRELFEIRCMQTDPNWSNFLYDPNERRLMLIDFGATRFYTKEFIDNYRGVIIAAVENNKDLVLQLSKDMGFLTGYETKQMEDAHFNAVMILGEMFRNEGEFNFGKQNVTNRIASLVPTMIAHRLCPPPEEIYSIHRKLSGIFLLCSKLNVKMECHSIYTDIVMKDYQKK